MLANSEATDEMPHYLANSEDQDEMLHYLANSEEPDEMPRNAGFHLGLHCLKIKTNHHVLVLTELHHNIKMLHVTPLNTNKAIPYIIV